MYDKVISHALMLLLAFATCSYAGDEFANPPAMGFRADAGPKGADRIAVILTPRRQAVLSAALSGQVVAINRELGQPFDGGEPLVQLDDATYRVNKGVAETMYESARGNLARIQKLADNKTRQRHAEAVLAAADVNLTATQRLYNDNHASHVDLENARRDRTVAQTNRELADSTAAKELINAKRELATAIGKLEIASEQLDACSLGAPWAGRVARVLVNEHEFVERGTPTIELIDDRVLLAKFLLPSSVFRSLHVGQELSLSVNETSETVKVRVSHIAAALDAASVTFEVHAEVDNADGNLRAGMNGWLSLAEVKGR